ARHVPRGRGGAAIAGASPPRSRRQARPPPGTAAHPSRRASSQSRSPRPRSRPPRSSPPRRRRLPEAMSTARDSEAMALALRALNQKERTERELSEWLRERGVEEADAAEAVERLLESGGLDDADFARRFAEDKRELKGWGPDRISEALRARGVAET